MFIAERTHNERRAKARRKLESYLSAARDVSLGPHVISQHSVGNVENISKSDKPTVLEEGFDMDIVRPLRPSTNKMKLLVEELDNILIKATTGQTALQVDWENISDIGPRSFDLYCRLIHLPYLGDDGCFEIWRLTGDCADSSNLNRWLDDTSIPVELQREFHNIRIYFIQPIVYHIPLTHVLTALCISAYIAPLENLSDASRKIPAAPYTIRCSSLIPIQKGAALYMLHSMAAGRFDSAFTKDDEITIRTCYDTVQLVLGQPTVMVPENNDWPTAYGFLQQLDITLPRDWDSISSIASAIYHISLKVPINENHHVYEKAFRQTLSDVRSAFEQPTYPWARIESWCAKIKLAPNPQASFVTAVRGALYVTWAWAVWQKQRPDTISELANGFFELTRALTSSPRLTSNSPTPAPLPSFVINDHSAE